MRGGLSETIRLPNNNNNNIVGSNKKRVLVTKRPVVTEVILPFSTDKHLQEQYKTFRGIPIRIGRIMEDLDSFAGSIAYSHADDGDVNSPSPTLVTASVNRMELLNPLRVDMDLKFSGNVVFVGDSSIDIAIRLHSYDNGKKEWIKNLESSFTMVARDPFTKKKQEVNRLLVETDEEKAAYEEAKNNSEARKAKRKLSLDKVSPAHYYISGCIILKALISDSN